ncbi:MAG: hypothetical protein U0930_11580 [Pirellulales bacterium]
MSLKPPDRIGILAVDGVIFDKLLGQWLSNLGFVWKPIVQLQFRITSLIALNYLIALMASQTIDATFFLFLIQPLLIWGIGKLLNSAVPKAMRLAAKDNYIRMNGTRSDNRRNMELAIARTLQLQLFYLVGIVTFFTNLFVLMVPSIVDYLPEKLQKVASLFYLVYIIIAFEFTRRCYMYLVREYGEQIAERYMQYMQKDMDDAQNEEEHRERHLKPLFVPPS